MTQPANNSKTDATRRRGIRRTAWAVALVAAGVYVAFLLSAMLP